MPLTPTDRVTGNRAWSRMAVQIRMETQAIILNIIHDKPGCTSRWIQRRTDLSRAVVNRYLQNLIAEGLVSRARDGHSAQSFVYRMAERG